MKHRPILYGIFILLAITVSLVYFISNNRGKRDTLSPKPWHRLSYAGSLGTGKDKVGQGIASLQQNIQALDEVSFYWYNLRPENKISRDQSVSDKTEEDAINVAKQNAKKVLFGIGDHGDAEKADDFLDDSEKQKNHISQIISIIDEKGYDGVMIDYEDLRSDQEDNFTKYMQQLSEAVRSEGKIIGISVPVETRGRIFHGINIVDVSNAVDKMHMNIYEEHGADTVPGPIASIDWVHAVIKNAIDQGVKPNKITLGTAHSGHDWNVTSGTFSQDISTNGALGILSSQNASLSWDVQRQSNYFEYTDEGKKHVVWLEDARSFMAKIDLAQKYQLQGIFVWYLGGEDPRIWETIESTRQMSKKLRQ